MLIFFHILVIREYWFLRESRIPIKPVLGGARIVALSTFFWSWFHCLPPMFLYTSLKPRLGYNTVMLWLPIYFCHGILQRSYRKMTIKWSFSYNSFVNISLYNIRPEFFYKLIYNPDHCNFPESRYKINLLNYYFILSAGY